MTTLVAIRQQPPFEHSMSDQPVRRTSKRLTDKAAADDLENDDDFVFTRKSKKQKTDGIEQTKTTAGPVLRRSPRNQASAGDTTTASPSREAEKRRREASAGANGAPRSTRSRKTADGRAKSVGGASHNSSRQRAEVTRHDRDGNNDNDDSQAQQRFRSPPQRPPRQDTATMIALPTSDTPVINRNKEMRKKAAEGTLSSSSAGGTSSKSGARGGGGASSSSNRRSSLGTRGRRASSLIENGHAAIPHREVDASQFYKHISAEGLLEPMRMRQLLTWCAERALPEKVPQGVPSTDPALGARMIQDELVKDFSTRSDFYNWLARDESVVPPGKVLKPNPRNVELDGRVASLQQRIKRLQDEKSAWLSIQEPIPDQPQLFPPTTTTTDDVATDAILDTRLPDTDLLDADEGRIRRYLADELEPWTRLRARVEERLRAARQTLEFELDLVADGAHRLAQRVRVAGRQADVALGAAADGLRRREQTDRERAGTGALEVMEVLRGLGRLLPENGGGVG